jgi:hypothetical protein
MHDDYVEECPQSGERIRGKQNVRTVYENYPGIPSLIDYGYMLEGTKVRSVCSSGFPLARE